ncbi:GPP34 family phosphoprotein [Saccharopolyspora gloriosae]|uniref:GOLPH3/VPS74 family protein n=1 Tax=Saccharopolyspora gloriosae TaxID=455344 RepID=UPI001FB6851B|nr:GPP34 family phosphoprotein [Saccharopolyspora gloriosae]
MSVLEDRPAPVTLPDEFVLLLHRADGGHRAGQADLLTSVAELGELALRDRVEVAARTKLTVLDPRATGIDWADELLGRLVRKAGPKNKPVELTGLLPRRIGRFREHRELLTAQGLLRHQRRKLLGFIPDDLYFPVEPVREALVAEVREVARRRRPVDGRCAVLCALAHSAGIGPALGCDAEELAMLESVWRGDGLGEAARRPLAAVSSVTAVTVSAAATGAAGY